MRKAKLIFLFILFGFMGHAQDAITIKHFGMTIHPFGDKTANLQPNKLDKNARFVLNYGLFLGYEKFVYEDLVSIKFIQGFLADCSNGFAMISHIGVRGAIYKSEKHRVYVGLGPAFLVRDSWNRFGEEYDASGYFNETYSKTFGDLQWKAAPIAIDIEYDFAFNPKNQLSFSFTPGVPLAMILSVGWKHWLHVKEFDKFKPYVPRKWRSKL
ncbi:MAG: hypothetical protein P8P74_02780 [Crocinitomicaceae bacterium]|nr:hypothetical protein [Crocinitomicaceae bacterium]